MVELTVNGEKRSVRGAATIGDLLRALGIDPRSVAVERNRSIVARQELDGTRIEEGDTLEIIRMVGGG